MPVDTAAGSKIAIGPANSTATTQNDYEALAYVIVGEVESISEFGDSASTVTFTSLNDRRVRKFKGSFDAGTITVTIGHDSGDAGQIDLQDALSTDDDYAFRVTLDDASTGSPSSPTTYYFRGKVMALRTNPGTTESIVMSTAEIGINSAIVKVAAV